LIQALIWIAAIVLAGMLLGVAYQKLATRRDWRVHPPPGKLIDLETHRLHLLESGRDGPTVVLEAGLMSTVLSWSALQGELARAFRVVSYDKAGLGWSDEGPMPRTSDRIVDELHSLLERASIPPPYILVGHSFGGLTVPLFAARYPEQTAGVVLVDPVAPVEWNPPSEHDRRLTEIGAKVCRRAAFLSRIGLIRFVAFLLTTGAKGPAGRLVRLISRGTPAESGSVSSPWFWALPANERKMASIFWIQKKFAVTIASQLENMPVSARRVRELSNFCDKPVVILTARTAPQNRREEHAAIAGRLPQGRHVIAEKSNHWIMWEEPQLVIRAIQAVADSLRGEVAASAAAASESSGLGKNTKDASQVLRD
jgi:pimeloyl-ACP methyl ester carboxylesterase